MSDRTDPRCPECGGKIGATATYCMHCSADLTAEQTAADTDGNETWDRDPATRDASATGGAPTTEDASATGGAPATEDASATSGAPATEDASATRDRSAGGLDGLPGGTDDGQLLDPDGLVDNTLTVVVGIAGGIVVGLVGTTVLTVVTASPWALLFGFLAWLGATAYLVRLRTVQGAVSKTGYAVALVLLSVPVIAFSPAATVEGGRGSLFVVLAMFVLVPAAVAAAVGWVAGLFVPDDPRGR